MPRSCSDTKRLEPGLTMIALADEERLVRRFVCFA
jgi:hypothetical protein